MKTMSSNKKSSYYNYKVTRWIAKGEWKTSVSSPVTIDMAIEACNRRCNEDGCKRTKSFQEEAEDMICSTKEDVMKLQSWCKSSLTIRILKQAQQLSMKTLDGQEITSLSQMYCLFQHDARISTAKLLWDCFFGIFDKNPNWDTDFEKEYMRDKTWGYRELKGLQEDHTETKRNKGCIAKIICTVKNQLCDSLNQRARTTHGNRLGITREASEVEINKDKRRPLGVFMPWCYKDRDGNAITSDPDDIAHCKDEEYNSDPEIARLKQELQAVSQGISSLAWLNNLF